MNRFRRIVFAAAEVVAVIALIICTIGFGNWAEDRGTPFVIGAVAGFGIGALQLSVVFSLTEIAANTRASLALLQRLSGQAGE